METYVSGTPHEPFLVISILQISTLLMGNTLVQPELDIRITREVRTVNDRMNSLEDERVSALS